MAADFEDWTRGITIITGAIPMGADFPDWTSAIAVASGSGGGPVSLSGAGETTTPGLLTQAGGFDVTEPGSDGITLTTTGASAIQLVTQHAGNIVLLVDNNVGGVNGVLTIENFTAGGITIRDANNGGITIDQGPLGNAITLHNGEIILTGLPLTSTGTPNSLFKSGGVVHIT
jgi:hypothetical protein